MKADSMAVEDEYGLLSTDIFVNPYPLYHMLRYADPVHFSKMLNAWILTRYKDVYAMLRDGRLSLAQRRPSATAQMPQDLREGMVPIDEFLAMWMLNTDPPEHTQLRALVAPFFAARQIDKLRAPLEADAEAFLGPFLEQGRMDVVNDFAYPYHIAVIGKIVGVPPADGPTMVGWFNDMATFFQFGPTRTALLEKMHRAIREFDSYFRALAEERRRRPVDDVLSRLATTDLTPAQISSMCALLLFSGWESTAGLIGTAMLLLLQNPEQMELLRADPSLIKSAADEFLRYDGPFMRQDRAVAADVEIDGKVLKAGQRVFLVLGAANHDPARFPNPDVLDIRRPRNDHVALGGGAHYCLGAPLARLEVQVAVNSLLARLKDIRFAGDSVRWRPHFNHRDLLTLPVSFAPRARS